MRANLLAVTLLIWLALLIVLSPPGQAAWGSEGSSVPRVMSPADENVSPGLRYSPPLTGVADEDHTRGNQAQGLPTLLSSTVRMVVVLSGLIAVLLLIFYFIKPFLSKTGALGGREKVIRVIASNYMGGKKVISLVSVADHLLVIGITPNHISLLTCIQDKETIEKLKAAQDPGYAVPSFINQLKRFSRKWAGGDDARKIRGEGCED